MYNQNRFLCAKKEKLTDLSSCIFCHEYIKGNCPGSLEINLLRQKSKNSYELYYPLQEAVNNIAEVLMISTTEVLERLIKEYDLKIDRTLLFKYQENGLLEKKQKIGEGRGRGVKTYWSNKIPLKIYYIKKLLREGVSLDEMKRCHNILYKFENPELLKHLGPYWFDKDSRDFKTKVKEHEQIMGQLNIPNFDRAVYYFAAAESNIKYSFNSSIFPWVGIGYDEKDIKNNYITAYLKDPKTGEFIKQVEFKKVSIKIIPIEEVYKKVENMIKKGIIKKSKNGIVKIKDI